MNYKIANKKFNLKEIKTDEDLLRFASKEDLDFFNKCIKGNPDQMGFSGTGFDEKGIQIPFSLGPHSVKSMRNLLEKSNFKNGNMLEIGFNLGNSASIWLTLLPNIKLTSVDISDKAETLAAAKIVGEKFPERFEFILSDSKQMLEKIKDKKFELAFIDGDHTEEGIIADIENCLKLGIRTMIFDDFLPQYGMTIPALSKFNVEMLEVDGNLCLAKIS